MQQTPEADPQLGALVNELAAGWRPRLTGFFLVLVFTAFGVIGGVADDNMLLVALSVVLAIVLIALVQFLLSGIRVRVYVHGIERKTRLGTQRLAWNELQSGHEDRRAIQAKHGGEQKLKAAPHRP